MTYQGLDAAPVPPGVFASVAQQAAGVDVHGDGHPAVADAGELDVVGGDQSGLFDVDKAVAQDVAAQQDLTGATLEGAQVQAGRCQLESLVVPRQDLGDGHEQLAPADVGDQAGYGRVVVIA